MGVLYRTQSVGDVEVFYREAGPPDAPIILLLHGFPTAGHMFRDLIPLLAGQYRVIAPDLPGFGNTKAPPRGQFAYTFDNLAKVIGGFIEALGLQRYALYVFDYGAPTGFRIARAHPERVTAIISQNGKAYLEGFSDAWGPMADLLARADPRTSRSLPCLALTEGHPRMAILQRRRREPRFT
jgi:pimeloyl-ACP methyl ester carboxylesterase